MPSVRPSSATLCLLVQLAVGNIHGALARPAGQDLTPWLEITSNIEPGRIYSGDVIGPFVLGNDLAITCSTGNSEAVSLSWWEGEEQLPSVVSFGDEAVSRSFNLGTLQAKDSGRHFTCRDLVSGTEKSVDLHLVDDHMEIQINGHSLKDEGKVDVFPGADFILNCFVNGSEPSTGTWWEGEVKLPTKRTKLHEAICNQLALGPARMEDDGRLLTCRARNGQLTKTVVLNVMNGARNPVPLPPSPGTRATTWPSVNVTNITLQKIANEIKIYLVVAIVVVLGFAVLVAFLIFVIVKKYRSTNQQKTSSSQRQGNSAENQSDLSNADTSMLISQ